MLGLVRGDGGASRLIPFTQAILYTAGSLAYGGVLYTLHNKTEVDGWSQRSNEL